MKGNYEMFLIVVKTELHGQIFVSLGGGWYVTWEKRGQGPKNGMGWTVKKLIPRRISFFPIDISIKELSAAWRLQPSTITNFLRRYLYPEGKPKPSLDSQSHCKGDPHEWRRFAAFKERKTALNAKEVYERLRISRRNRETSQLPL